MELQSRHLLKDLNTPLYLRQIEKKLQKLYSLNKLNLNNQPDEGLNFLIAHELFNPLGVILNYIHGCIHRLEQENIAKEDLLHILKTCVKQSSRAYETILRLKGFNFQKGLNFESAHIDVLINETILMNYYETPDFPIPISYRPALIPKVMIDKFLIEQVILNLIKNSCEALRDSMKDCAQIFIEINRINKNEIEVCIIDNGPGFSSIIQHQLFEINFTTKKYAAGMGLSVCQSILKAHGTNLIAKNNPQGGACFSFILSTNS